MRPLLRAALTFALLAALPAPVAAAPVLVIAHRGASADRPEHTASAYRLAVRQGADFIEPDLVMTRDGVLVARHENEIGGTTDVAAHPEFAARRATKVIDGQTVTGWFTEDFTLAELKTLRGRERLPQIRPANTAYDGADPILTLQEVIDLARAEGAAAGRSVGVYAELKHPTYFASIGLPMERALTDALVRNRLDRHDAPVIVQCFETGALKAVRARLPVRTVLLVDEEGAPADLVAAGDKRTYADLITPAGLAQVAAYADGIGVAKALILPRDAAGAWRAPTDLVKAAHAAGLVVHVWTFRPENAFLPAPLRRGVDPAGLGDLQAELRAFFALGVDGVFSDRPAEAVAAQRTGKPASP